MKSFFQFSPPQFSLWFSAILSLLFIFPIGAQAQTGTTSDGFDYILTNGTATITGYSGASATLIIPSTVTVLGSDYPVTSIAEGGAFGLSLTSITIPASITNISDVAFVGDSSLTSITVDSANLNYSSTNGVLFNQNKTTLLVCPAGKTGSYILPASLTRIGDSAFQSCSGLTSITIPLGVNSIGGGAFSGCSGLNRIDLPASVTSIGDSPFQSCSSLTSITVDSANLNYSSTNGVLFNQNKTTLLVCPEGKAGSYTLPASVIDIGASAFASCSGLTSLDLPASLTSIGASAFASCNGLTGITLPASLTRIGDSAFLWCSALTGITITGPSSLTSIGNLAFYGCSSLTNLTLPTSLTSIGDSAFQWCSSFTSLTIPDSVTTIGASAFDSCRGLTSLNIPDSVTNIGGGAFSGCSNLTSVTLPASLTSIGDSAFLWCSSLTSLKIPTTVTSIGTSAFDSCSNLTNLILPPSLTSIGDYAFSGCSGLTNLTLPASVTHIGASAFQWCIGVTNLTLPPSLTSIGDYTFSGCSGLTSLTLPASVTTLGDGVFNGCSLLTTAIFKGNAPTIGSSVFDSTDPGFTVEYYLETTGFTAPTWNGYPSSDLGYSLPIFGWLHTNGLPYSANLSSVPNQDGIPLLMDYALNLNPNENQSGTLPKQVISGNQISLTYYAGKTDVQYIVEISSDLQSWTTSGITLSAPDSNGLRTATATISTPRLFMHLKVTH